MRLFYIDKIESSLTKCTIEGAEARHIYKVLRMRPGDAILLMDREGKRFKSIIEKIYRGKVEVLIKEIYPSPRPSPIETILYISLIRSAAMDFVIQKSSELAVDIIQPFYSERSIIKIPEKKVESRLRHWNEIAKNSAKQSGRTIPAKILKPTTLDEILKNWENNKKVLKLLLWEQETSQSIKYILRQKKDVKKVVGIIGPEGGFTEKEIERSKSSGFYTVSMGKRILRAETAAITFIAVVQYELGDLGSIL